MPSWQNVFDTGTELLAMALKHVAWLKEAKELLPPEDELCAQCQASPGAGSKPPQDVGHRRDGINRPISFERPGLYTMFKSMHSNVESIALLPLS